MPRCKICGEHEDLGYWLCRNKWCIQCYVEIDKRIDDRLKDRRVVVTDEDRRRWKVSKKAVDDYLKSKK